MHHTGYFSTRRRQTVASHRILFHEEETNSCITQDTFPQGRDKQLHHKEYLFHGMRITVTPNRILFTRTKQTGALFIFSFLRLY